MDEIIGEIIEAEIWVLLIPQLLMLIWNILTTLFQKLVEWFEER